MADEQQLLDYLKQVTADLRRTQASAAGRRARASEPIAIVGDGLPLPGRRRTPEELWELLADGRDAHRRVPRRPRLGPRGALRPRPGAPRHARTPGRAGSSTTSAEFDAAFFGISPARGARDGPAAAAAAGDGLGGASSAPGIDPRVAARQPAPASSPASPCRTTAARIADRRRTLEGYLLTGSVASVVSGRVAYALGLEGPAVTRRHRLLVVAGRHAPGRARRCARGECSLALAGGVDGDVDARTSFVEFSRQRGLCARTAAASRSPRPPTAPAGPRASACCCWSGSPTPQRHGHPVLAVVRGSRGQPGRRVQRPHRARTAPPRSA